jgi:hypothetical protein
MPGFQNFCMDDNRSWFKDYANMWPNVTAVEVTYKATKKGSLPRKLTADSINCKNPFKTFEEGSKEWKEWVDLLDKDPDISRDIILNNRVDWNGTYAWDDEHRAKYMLDEIPLDESYKSFILSRRTEAQIEKAAKSRCLRSMIEWDFCLHN